MLDELRALVEELAGEDCRSPVSVDGEGRRVHWLAPGYHQVGCGSCLVCRARKAIGIGEFYDPSLGEGPPWPGGRRRRTS
jgi:hypothetical protein